MFNALNLSNLHHHVLHTFDSSQCGFHLAQLDTQATQFDLVVRSAEDDDIALFCPAGIVARLINTHTLIVDEAFGSHLRQVVITCCHTDTANIKLANDTYRQFVAVAVDHKLLVVEQRMTHADAVGMCEFLTVGRNGDLRRTVRIEYSCLRCCSAELVEQAVSIFFTTAHDDMTLSDSLDEGRQFHVLQHTGRCSVDGIGSSTAEQVCQQCSIGGLILAGKDHSLTIEQGSTILLHRHVKRHGGDTQQGLYRLCYSMYMGVDRMCIEVVDNTLMTQHHTLRFTSRT